MRTIRECICDSMERTEDGVLPICLSYFIRNMAFLLTADSDMRLATDMPDMEIGGKKFDGKAKDNSSALDVMKVLLGNDFIRGNGQFIQLQTFLGWLLEQDEPENDDDDLDFDFWYSIDFLTEKWNEHARNERESD